MCNFGCQLRDRAERNLEDTPEASYGYLGEPLRRPPLPKGAIAPGEERKKPPETTRNCSQQPAALVHNNCYCTSFAGRFKRSELELCDAVRRRSAPLRAVRVKATRRSAPGGASGGAPSAQQHRKLPKSGRGGNIKKGQGTTRNRQRCCPTPPNRTWTTAAKAKGQGRQKQTSQKDIREESGHTARR
eukprot:5607356-Alexandrium_andersonii.AAC.1